MSKHLVTVAVAGATLVLAFGSCATPQAAQQEQPQPAPRLKPRQEAVAGGNLAYFDVAACFPRSPKLEDGAVTQEVVVGALVAARPQVLECLVPPDTRGPAEETMVDVKAKVTTAGTEVTASGENLTPEGAACIKREVEKATQALKLTAPKKTRRQKKAPPEPAPVEGELSIKHRVGVDPAVEMGINPGSDVVGKVRTSLPQWCECFEPWKNSPPRTLTVNKIVVKHIREQPKQDAADAGTAETAAADAGTEDAAGSATASQMDTPDQIEFEPTGDEKADEVAACLIKRISQLEFPKPGKVGDEVGLFTPAPLRFIHSGVAEPMADAPADIRFLQLNALRAQADADVSVTRGRRALAAQQYTAVVQRYQKTNDWTLLKEMQAKCAALTSADEVWIKSLDPLLKLDERRVALIEEVKETDPSLAQEEELTKKQLAATQTTIEEAKQTLVKDKASCPKVSYD